MNLLNEVAFVSAGRGRARHSDPNSASSARVRACGELAHGLTHITIRLGRVGIYITQSSFTYLIWD